MTKRESDTMKSGNPRIAKRMSGRRAVPLFLGALVGIFILGVFGWNWYRAQRGEVVAMRAIDDERVLLLRTGARERGYRHLSIEHVTRGELWTVTLFGQQDDVAFQFFTVELDGAPTELVSVRAREARGHSETHVFRADDGAFVWRAARASREEEGATYHGPRSLIGETLMFDLYDGVRPEVIASDLATGEERYRHPLEIAGDAHLAFAFGDRLFVDVGAGLAEVSAEGARPIGAAPGEACAVSDELLYRSTDGDLHRVDLDVEGDTDVITLAGLVPATLSPSRWLACARRGEDVEVLTFAERLRLATFDGSLSSLQGVTRSDVSEVPKDLPESDFAAYLRALGNGVFIPAGGGLRFSGNELARADGTARFSQEGLATVRASHVAESRVFVSDGHQVSALTLADLTPAGSASAQ